MEWFFIGVAFVIAGLGIFRALTDKSATSGRGSGLSRTQRKESRKRAPLKPDSGGAKIKVSGRYVGNPLPAMIRSIIVSSETVKQMNADGRFGKVTIDRVQAAVGAFERGEDLELDDPNVDLTAFIYEVCSSMMRDNDALWRQLGL